MCTFRSLAAGAFCIVVTSTGLGAQAASSTIYAFVGGANGLNPQGPLIADSSGVLYGTTSGLGSKSKTAYGTVFSLTPPSQGSKAWTEKTLYTFKGGVSDGANPLGGLVMDPSGNLYGTTWKGTKTNSGLVFELSPPAGGGTTWTETILYEFTNYSNGGFPEAGLLRTANGDLFGTASGGGGHDEGNVFELTPPAKGGTSWQFSSVYSFAGGAGDGAMPTAPLSRDSSGALYGTTAQGGPSSVCGEGGAGCGTVFKLTPPPKGQSVWTEEVLYIFTGGADGGLPYSNMILDQSGNLYGTASDGGNCSGGPTCGVVFMLSPPTGGQGSWAETVLYDFQGGSDGLIPLAGLVRKASGDLFGTTAYGASADFGTVFKIQPPKEGGNAWNETVLHTFVGGKDGAHPFAGLLMGSANKLYGTASAAGSPHSYGTVYSVAP